MGNNEIKDNKKYTSNTDDFDDHADAAVRCRAHCQMEHILGFTRSHWMPPLGEYSHCIAKAAAMVDSFGRNHKTITKNIFLAS
jgi:hypothetical protein